ncbi:hypothetical protein CHS0354_020460 [Potamilus streckersoni]|uniref:Mitochondria-eating protein C-terminal domain-containing protein n=1 Tax=Potamilus streckersoni TaxID=2493646 RepID=A0AAE0TBX1_9BIVA|nr:hypothetical protein CHS0354_020460 [Potamilus streckersoni]
MAEEKRLEKCFRLFEDNERHEISRNFVSWVIEEFESTVQGKLKENTETLSAFLVFLERGNWTKAKSLYPKAKEDYERYLKFHENRRQMLTSTKGNETRSNLKDSTMAELEKLQPKSRTVSSTNANNNSGDSDLIDPKYPVQLAERFSKIYQHEYKDAFDELRRHGHSEKDVIYFLLNIVQHVYFSCMELKKSLLDCHIDKLIGPNLNIASTDEHMRRYNEMQECRKEAEEKLPSVCKEFMISRYPYIAPPTIPDKKAQAFEKSRIFAERCVQVVWLMSIQQPQLCLEWIETNAGRKSLFDPDSFISYKKSGQFVDYCVWPLVLLHDNGQILAKGIAHCCN